jgi:hypothetical protein
VTLKNKDILWQLTAFSHFLSCHKILISLIPYIKITY